LRPGQFVISGLIAHLYGGAPLFHAVAHVPSEVATIGIDALAEVIRRLSPTAVVRLTSYSWRILSAHIHQKSVALTLPLRHRLLHQLRILADRFPQEHARGTLIDLPLIHEDLAHFVVSRRENVCRMLRALEGRAGGLRGRRILVWVQVRRRSREGGGRPAGQYPRRRRPGCAEPRNSYSAWEYSAAFEP
jgi:CRP-like cAMP-binding protein